MLMLLNVTSLLLVQQTRPANSVAPSFLYVDAVVLNMIFLSDLCAQPLDQFMVHVVRKIIGGKFVAHLSLTGNNTRQGVAPGPCPLLKVKRGPEKHLHNLETHDEAKDDNEASLPDQLYFHTLTIDQVTKNDT